MSCCLKSSETIEMILFFRQVLSRCYQLLASLFQGPSAVARPFILAVGSRLLSQLEGVEKSRPQSSAELQAVQDGIRALEALVFAADETHRKSLRDRTMISSGCIFRSILHLTHSLSTQDLSWWLCFCPSSYLCC